MLLPSLHQHGSASDTLFEDPTCPVLHHHKAGMLAIDVVITKYAYKVKVCCSWWRAEHHNSAPSESKALTAPWCHMRPCAKKAICTLQSSALHVGRPLMMGLWMSHLCTGPAPPGKEAPGKDPPLAGRPTPATLKTQASFPTCLGLHTQGVLGR